MSPLAAIAAAVDVECSDIGDMASGGVAAAGFLADFDAAVFGAVASDAPRRVPVAEVRNVSGSPREPFGTSTAARAAVFPPPDAFRADPVADCVSMAASGPLVDAFAVFAGGVVAPVGVAIPGVTFVALTAPSVPDGAFAAFLGVRPALAVLAAVALPVVRVEAAPTFAALAGAALASGALAGSAFAGAAFPGAVFVDAFLAGAALAGAAFVTARAGAVATLPAGLAGPPVVPFAGRADFVVRRVARAPVFAGPLALVPGLVATAFLVVDLAGVAFTGAAFFAAVLVGVLLPGAALAAVVLATVALPGAVVFAPTALPGAALAAVRLTPVALPGAALAAVRLTPVALPGVALAAVRLTPVALPGVALVGALDFAVRAGAFAALAAAPRVVLAAAALPGGVAPRLAFAGVAAFADALVDALVVDALVADALVIGVLVEATFADTPFGAALFAGMLFAPDLTDAFTAVLLPAIAALRTEVGPGSADFARGFVAPFADPGTSRPGCVVFLTPGLFALLGAWIAAPVGAAADRAPDETPRTTPASPAMASPKCKTGAWRTATHC